MLRRHAFALAAVVLGLASFAWRLTDLGRIPAGFYCDEASVEFNARSILETGRDEHGKSWPVFFRAFGDYKSGPYVYATALALELAGRSDRTVRLVPAVWLALLMIPTYVLLARTVHPGCGLLGVALLACEPWFHHFSHIAFELTATPFFLVSGVCCFVVGRGRAARQGLGVVFLALACYNYAPGRVLAPLLGLGMAWIYRRDFTGRAGLRRLGVLALVAAVSLAPLAWYLVREPRFTERVSYLNVFTSGYLKFGWVYKWADGHRTRFGLADQFDRSETSLRVATAVLNYVAYLSPWYLLVSGDENLRFGTPRFGTLSPATGLGVALALLLLWRRRDELLKLLVLWMLLYPVPGALTWENVPHAGRGVVGLPAFTLLGAIGLWEGLRRPSRPWVRAAAVLLVLAVQGAVVVHYQRYWRRDYSTESGGWMQYGFREAFAYVRDHHHEYEGVVILNDYLHYEAWITALHYSDQPARVWQERKTFPWHIHRTGQGRIEGEELRPRILYMVSPMPRFLDPRLRVVHQIPWEGSDDTAIAFLTKKNE